MKLWILERKGGARWDEAHGHVVRAATEEDARSLASKFRGSEGESVWLNADASTCIELTVTGMPEHIMLDFRAG